MIVLCKQRADQRVNKAEINADAVGEVEQRSVSHWFSTLKVCLDINFFAAIDSTRSGMRPIANQAFFSCNQNSHTLQKHHLKWFVYQWWGLRCYHLWAPSTVVVLSSAFCLSENWQRGIKLACLSSLSRTCFWSMFSVSETRYISCFLCSCAIQLCRKINC